MRPAVLTVTQVYAQPSNSHRSQKNDISSKYARKVDDFNVVIKALNFDAHGLCESKSAGDGTRTRTSKT